MAAFYNPYPTSQCFACGKHEATGACSKCRVATYCNGTCHAQGLEKGHGLVCDHYAAILASLAASLGFPAHLETPEERSGFAEFLEQKKGVLDPKAAPLTDPAKLLDAVWGVLSTKEREQWNRKAGNRALASGRVAFDQERLSFYKKDFAHRYAADDTLAKQFWRNLVRSEREFYTRQTERASSSSENVARKGVVRPSAHKRRRVVIETLVPYLEELPMELVVAIVNEASHDTAMRLSGTNTRFQKIVWKALYMRDIYLRLKEVDGVKYPQALTFLKEAPAMDGLEGFQEAYGSVMWTVAEEMARVFHEHVKGTYNGYLDVSTWKGHALQLVPETAQGAPDEVIGCRMVTGNTSAIFPGRWFDMIERWQNMMRTGILMARSMGDDEDYENDEDEVAFYTVEQSEELFRFMLMNGYPELTLRSHSKSYRNVDTVSLYSTAGMHDEQHVSEDDYVPFDDADFRPKDYAAFLERYNPPK